MFTTPCFIRKYFRTSQEVRGIGYYLHHLKRNFMNNSRKNKNFKKSNMENRINYINNL